MKKILFLTLNLCTSVFSILGVSEQCAFAFINGDVEALRQILSDPKEIALLKEPLPPEHIIFNDALYAPYKDYGYTLFHLADVNKDGINILKTLLDFAPDCINIPTRYDTDGTTPLLQACASKKLAVVEMLLQRGADVHQFYTNLNEAKITPLRLACSLMCPDLFRLLLDYGASIDKDIACDYYSSCYALINALDIIITRGFIAKCFDEAVIILEEFFSRISEKDFDSLEKKVSTWRYCLANYYFAWAEYGLYGLEVGNNKQEELFLYLKKVFSKDEDGRYSSYKNYCNSEPHIIAFKFQMKKEYESQLKNFRKKHNNTLPFLQDRSINYKRLKPGKSNGQAMMSFVRDDDRQTRK